MICRRCEVGWVSRWAGPYCWVCGDEGQHGDAVDMVNRPRWQPMIGWSYVPEDQRRTELGDVA